MRARSQYDAGSPSRWFGTHIGHAVPSPFRKRTRASTASVFVSVRLWFRKRAKPTRCAFVERVHETVRNGDDAPYLDDPEEGNSLTPQGEMEGQHLAKCFLSLRHVWKFLDSLSNPANPSN
jgi:hypothetical protein